MTRTVFVEPAWKLPLSYAYLTDFPPDGYAFVVARTAQERMVRAVSRWPFSYRALHLLGHALPMVLLRSWAGRWSAPPPGAVLTYAHGHLVLRPEPWVVEVEYPSLLLGTHPRHLARFRRAVERALASPYCRKIRCWSEAGRRSLLAELDGAGFAHKIEVIPHAVPARRFVKRYEDEKVTLLLVGSGNIHGEFTGRGGRETVTAFALLRRRFPHLELVIRSDLPADLRAQIQGLPGIRVLEQTVPWAALDREFRAADIFVMVSYATPPFSLLDAMSYELPVVSLRSWANPEYVQHGVTGLLLAPPARPSTDGGGSLAHEEAARPPGPTPDRAVVSQLVEALAWLIESPDLRRRLGRQGRWEVEHGRFSIPARERPAQAPLRRGAARPARGAGRRDRRRSIAAVIGPAAPRRSPGLSGPAAAGTWLGFLALTVIIPLWPVSPSPTDPLPVQSVSAVRDLRWFLPLIYAWVLALGALLFLVRGGSLERVALCVLFTVVFVQFWARASPWGNSGDSVWLMGHVTLLREAGRLPPWGHAALTYFDYPALLLLDLVLTEVSGGSVFLATQLYLIASGLAFALLVFLTARRLLGSPEAAAVATVLAMGSSVVLGVVTNQFHPINLATLSIVTFHLLLVRRLEEPMTRRSAVLLTLLIAAAAFGYMFTPVYFSAVLLAAHLLDRLARTPLRAPVALAVLPVTAFAAWFTFATVWSFRVNVSALPEVVEGFLAGEWLLATRQVLSGNLGPRYPWWGNAARLFWGIVVFGLGTLLMLARVARVRALPAPRRLEVAIFAGTLVTVLIGAVLTAGAVHGGWSRYVWIAPLVLAPAVVDLLRRPRARPAALALAVAGLAALPPTFLSNADLLSAHRAYRHELAAAEFLAATHGTGAGVTLYGLPVVPAVSYVYLPEARLRGGPYLYGIREADAWRALEDLVEEFGASGRSASVLIHLPKGRAGYQERLGILPDHPRWETLAAEVEGANRIYDSGPLTVSEP